MKQGWEIKKLGEVATILNGYAFDSKLFSEDSNDMPLIRIRDIKRGYTETFYKGDFSEEYIIRKGDYLIGMDGEFNIAEWKGDDALLNQRVCKIIANDIVDRYLFWYMPVVLKQIEGATPFVTVKHLSSKQLLNTIIPVPSREEQERIVAELDCLSGVIERKREQLRELDALAQSIFYQMFGDPITNEKGWEIKKLGEVCKFSQGVQVDLPLQTTEMKKGWNRFLRIVDYTTCNTDVRYVDITNEKYFVKYDDVVIVRYGASAGFVGIEKEGILANNLFKLNHDRNILNYKYLYYLLSTDYYKNFVKDIAFGAAMPALSFNSFKVFNIIIPPIAIQQDFVSLISHIENNKKLIELSLKEFETLYNSRMNYYFN